MCTSEVSRSEEKVNHVHGRRVHELMIELTLVNLIVLYDVLNLHFEELGLQEKKMVRTSLLILFRRWKVLLEKESLTTSNNLTSLKARERRKMKDKEVIMEETMEVTMVGIVKILNIVAVKTNKGKSKGRKVVTLGHILRRPKILRSKCENQ
jgi:hypothetical protein